MRRVDFKSLCFVLVSIFAGIVSGLPAQFLFADDSPTQPDTDVVAKNRDTANAVGLGPVATKTGPPRSAIVIPLHEVIKPLSGEVLKRKFAEALNSDVDVIILDIRSPGGMVYVTRELMDMILDAEAVETVAFIQKEAISGAALVALACDKIVMRPDARMGDAGEIVMGPDGMFRFTEEKSRSELAQKVRDTAEKTGRPIALAEKMTDKDMIVFRCVNQSDGSVRYISDKEWESLEDTEDWEKGKPIREANKDMFFIVNGKRAVDLGMADFNVRDTDELYERLNLETPVKVMERTGIDTAIWFLNTKFATFLLLFIGMIALVIELGAPGIGIGGLTSMLCFGLFFWSRFLGGTAGWLEVTLFVLGILFIGMEVFVIPGFGVAGVGGIALMLGSLVMASRRFLIPGNSEELAGLGWDVATVAGAFMGFMVAMLVLAQYIGEIPGLSRLTLKPPVAMAASEAIDSDVSDDAKALLPGWQRVTVGELGIAASALRPSGKMSIDDYTVDVVTEGDFVSSGTPVKVIGKQGTRVVVRAEEDPAKFS